jgi:hypothetical protein
VGNVAYVSPPVKAARHQLTAAEIRHNGKLDEPVKEARSQLTAAEIRHNGKLEGAWKNILGIGVVFIFSWVAIDTTNSGARIIRSKLRGYFGGIAVPFPHHILTHEYLVVIGIVPRSIDGACVTIF